MGQSRSRSVTSRSITITEPAATGTHDTEHSVERGTLETTKGEKRGWVIEPEVAKEEIYTCLGSSSQRVNPGLRQDTHWLYESVTNSEWFTTVGNP